MRYLHKGKWFRDTSCILKVSIAFEPLALRLHLNLALHTCISMH